MSNDFSWSFDDLPDSAKDIVQVMVATCHFRNGTTNHDGSLGSIRITPLQMRDMLSFCIAEGHHPHSIKW